MRGTERAPVALSGDRRPIIRRPTVGACPRREREKLATESDYRAAIARVKNSPSTASRSDWDLVNKAAQQAGELGNRAREARDGR